jgi:hypothetical protein
VSLLISTCLSQLFSIALMPIPNWTLCGPDFEFNVCLEGETPVVLPTAARRWREVVHTHSCLLN